MRVGVLWFPGWSSTDHDLGEMMRYLHKHGIEYKSINLKGHNTKPEDLYGVYYQDWLLQADNTYHEVMKEWDIVFVGGLSMGGQLALYLASKYPVAGIITIGTPITMKMQKGIIGVFDILMKCFTHIFRYIPYQVEKKNSFLDKRIQELSLSRKGAYHTFPVSSVAEVYLLTKRTQRHFISSISAPILLIQSTTDHVVSHNNISLFQKNLKTPQQDIQILLVKNSYHLVNLDHDKFNVFDKIYAFIQKYSMIIQKSK